ncbi:hypothetical protein BJAS_P0131 [Bathymodiolus japonicus methanotrophic gill symbiont]|nr:hypothetical protein BJAS_P0131 [Bathymodiolus japonicus methanotrophic gill symbiont]
MLKHKSEFVLFSKVEGVMQHIIELDRQAEGILSEIAIHTQKSKDDIFLEVIKNYLLQQAKRADQARHATSRNSGTPVAIIRSPTQRMGDALNALRPQRLRTKAASSLLPHWLDGYSECNSCSSRVLLAHVESANFPVAYQGLKITTSLSSVSMIFSVGSIPKAL